MAAAPVKSCQSLPKRSPWGRLGSVLYTCKRLRRIRRRFQHILANSLITAAHGLFTGLRGLGFRHCHRERIETLKILCFARPTIVALPITSRSRGKCGVPASGSKTLAAFTLDALSAR